MTRLAIVEESGAVTNVIVTAEGRVPLLDPGLRAVACEGEAVGPGWTFSSTGGFSPPPDEPAPPRAVPVLRKTRLLEALDAVGARAKWEEAVAAAKQNTRDYWAIEPEIARTNPKMMRVARACGLDWDGLFEAASAL